MAGYLTEGTPVGLGANMAQLRALRGRQLPPTIGTGVPNRYNDESGAPLSPQTTGVAPNLQAIAFAPPGSAIGPTLPGRPPPWIGPQPRNLGGTE